MRRISRSPISAMRMPPSASRASVVGRFSSAFAAGPPSWWPAGEAGSRDGRDRPARVDAADPVVVLIGDQDAARGVDDDPRRMVELRVRRRTAVARESGDAGACDRRDDAVRSDLADAVAQVGHEHVARRIDGHAHGLVRAAPRPPGRHRRDTPGRPCPRAACSVGAGTAADAARRAAEAGESHHREKQTGSDEEHGWSRRYLLARVACGYRGGRLSRRRYSVPIAHDRPRIIRAG